MRTSLPGVDLIFIFAPAGLGSAAEKKTEPLTDAVFVTQAMKGGPAEVAPGKLAAGKAADIEVKRLGEQPAADHARANAESVRIAREAKVAVPDIVVGERLMRVPCLTASHLAFKPVSVLPSA